MSYERMKGRYENDPVFRRCVDSMVGMLHDGIATPHDIARMAVFAAHRWAMMHHEPMVVELREPGELAFEPDGMFTCSLCGKVLSIAVCVAGTTCVYCAAEETPDP